MATKKAKYTPPKTITSKLSPYELYDLSVNKRVETKTELKKMCKMSQRYHLVNYSGKTLATATSIDKAIQIANRLNGWGIDCIIDQKDLVAWDFHVRIFGAGHAIYDSATRRY